jgi:hypothetical protein
MKILLLILTGLSLSCSIFAQAYQYHPFVLPSKWVLQDHLQYHPSFSVASDESVFVETLIRDSIINNNTYSLIASYDAWRRVYAVIHPTIYDYFYYDLMGQNNKVLGGIREDSLKRVYYYNMEGTFNNPSFDSLFLQEVLLFDFSLGIGDSILRTALISGEVANYYMHVTAIDSVLLDDLTYRKRMYLKGYYSNVLLSDSVSYQWIEGIGVAESSNSNTALVSSKVGILGGLTLMYKTSVSPPYLTPTIRCFFEQNIHLLGSNLVYCDSLPSYLQLAKLTNHSVNIQIQPNPFRHQAKILVDGVDCNTLRIQIFDLTGRAVEQFEVPYSHELIIQRNSLEAGIYVYKLWADEKL